MKYTSYLLKEQFIDIDQLETKNVYLIVPSIFLRILISIFGLSLIFSLLPLTVVVDETRGIIYLAMKLKRKLKL